MKNSTCFRPVREVSAYDTDQFAYEPAENLSAALKALERANAKCRSKPSFSSVADACRKCRTTFAEFIGEALTAGASVRKTVLPRVQGLLTECQQVVRDALPTLSVPEERKLAGGYLAHIADRIRLAEALRTNALPGYLDEIEKALSKTTSASPAMA